MKLVVARLLTTPPSAAYAKLLLQSNKPPTAVVTITNGNQGSRLKRLSTEAKAKLKKIAGAQSSLHHDYSSGAQAANANTEAAVQRATDQLIWRWTVQ